MSNSSIDVLKVRVDMIESLFFGRKGLPSDGATVNQRLQTMDNRLMSLEREIPAVKSCSDTILKLSPFITEKKLQINQINEKIDSLLLRKDELQQFIRDLEAVKQHSHVLDSTFCDNIDIDECNRKLSDLESLIKPLAEESQSQSKELDSLLEAYEKAMIFISDVCQSWDEQAKQLERERIV